MAVEKKPWEQMPDEPDRWFSRFRRFKLMGESRSLLALYNLYRAKKAGKGGKRRNATSVPESWTIARDGFDWIPRATAWDAHQLEAFEQGLVDEKRKLKRKHVLALNGMLDKALQAIPELNPADADWKSLTSTLRAVGQEFREAFNDLPTQKVADVSEDPREAILRRLGEKFTPQSGDGGDSGAE